jgi:hypothetical protein
MPPSQFNGRRAGTIENAHVRVTVLEEGGHIAEICDKRTGVNPLWIPPWPSIEPSTYDAAVHPQYGAGAESRLLAGIMGHNLCMDIFGGPSEAEAAAGLTVHGEAPVLPWRIEVSGGVLGASVDMPVAQLRVRRRVELRDRAVRIVESVENLSAADRPIGWTQHVTLGPPFLQKGTTLFRASATRSKVLESEFGSHEYLTNGSEFDWPHAPARNGSTADLRVLTNAPASCAYTAHLMDPRRAAASFVAFSPSLQLAFGYVWRQTDFPWMGIWEENYSRAAAPWAGKTLTRGMEFGVSPFPETRRAMVDRRALFGVQTYRWIPAHTKVEVEYYALTAHASAVPETLEWPA